MTPTNPDISSPDHPGGGAAIYLCNKTTATWTCESQGCSSIYMFKMNNLKPALRRDALSSSYIDVFGSPTATPIENASAVQEQASTHGTTYTSGQMAGVGVGIAVPLLIALSAVLWLLHAERKKTKAIGAWELQWNAQNAQYAYGSVGQKRTHRDAELAPDAERQELPGDAAEQRERIPDSQGGTNSSEFRIESSPHLN